MACLGTHFAITEDVAALLTQNPPLGSADVLAWLEDLEERYRAMDEEGWVCTTEKAWDGIHRSLTDGKLELGATPRHLCILGATERFWVRRGDGQVEYIVNLLEPADVQRVADSIRGIDQAELLRGYEGIDPDSFYARYVPEDDFEYTRDNFQRLQAFFARAAAAGRWVVFRVDQ